MNRCIFDLVLCRFRVAASCAMELDQKLGMSLDQLMKSDVDMKNAVRSTRLRGRPNRRPSGPRRPRVSSAMEISESKSAKTKLKASAKGKVKGKAVVKKAISKNSSSMEIDSVKLGKSERQRRRGGADVQLDKGIEKIEKTSSSKKRVILTSKKQAEKKQTVLSSKSVDRRTIKVTNIPYDVHWRDVKEAFARLAPVERCDVEKGMATVVFQSRPDAQRAIDTYNGGNMNGRVIKASFAQL